MMWAAPWGRMGRQEGTNVVFQIEYQNKATTKPYNSLIPLTWTEGP